MEINDGKGLFDKYGMIDELLKKLDLAADTKGAVRCGLIWDMTCMLKALKNGMKKNDEEDAQKVEALKAQIQTMEEGAKK